MTVIQPVHQVSLKCLFYNEIIWSPKTICILVFFYFFQTIAKIHLRQHLRGAWHRFYMAFKNNTAHIHIIRSFNLSCCFIDGGSYLIFQNIDCRVIEKKTSMKSSEKTCCGICQYLLWCTCIKFKHCMTTYHYGNHIKSNCTGSVLKYYMELEYFR